ncbi:MAG: hypothetical protein D6813_01145, partial [Calditrichaeota bacterium]
MLKLILSIFRNFIIVPLLLAARVAYSNAIESDTLLVKYGDNIKASIDLIGEIDIYNFEGNAGDMVVIQMASKKNNFGSQIELLGPDGKLMASDSTFYGGALGLARIEGIRLPSSGKYTIKAMEQKNDQTGDYNLSLQRTFGPSNATFIRYNTTLSSSIDQLAEIDAFVFEGSPGDKIVIQMTSKNGMGGRIELYKPDGTLIKSSRVLSGFARIDNVTLDRSGKFTLFVMSAHADFTLPYGLTLQRTFNVPNAISLTYNSTISQSIEQLAEIDAYAFKGKSGDIIIVQMASEAGIGGQIELYGPNGALIITKRRILGTTRIDTLTLRVSGAYTIFVTSPQADLMLPYGLTLQRTFEPPGAILLNFDEPVTSSIAQLSEIDIYTFEADSHDTVSIFMRDIEQTSFEPQIELFSVNGSRITSATDNDIAIISNFIVPESGIYTIFAMDQNGYRMGEYEIGVHFITKNSMDFGEWHSFRVDPGLAFTANVAVPDVERLFVLLKKNTSIGYTGTWDGSIEILKGNERIAYQSGRSDYGIQITEPVSGTYTVVIRGDQSGKGIIKFSSALDTLNLGEWKISEILRPYGFDWLQLDVPPNQKTLYLQTEGFGLWSSLDVYYDSLGNSDQHWVFANFGAGYHIEGQIEYPAAGRYYLRYMDSAVITGDTTQVRQYLIFADAQYNNQPSPSQPIIIDLSTYNGGTTGIVTVIAYGTGFSTSATVSLKRNGFPDALPDTSIVDSVGREIAVVFDLSSAEPGEWSFVVTNPDSQIAIAKNPFIIESGGNHDMWVEIAGKDKIRRGRFQRYIFRYGNRGNINAIGVPLWIAGIPTSSVIKYGANIIPLPLADGTFADGWEDVPLAYDIDGEFVIPLLFPVIPPGTTEEIELSINTSSKKQFVLRAWTTRPFYSSPIDPQVYECIRKILETVIPSGGCLGSFFEELSKGLIDTYYILFRNHDPKLSSFANALWNLLTSCGENLLKAEKLKEINEIIGDFMSGAGIGAECDIAFPNDPEAGLPIDPVGSTTPEDKYGPTGYDPASTTITKLQRFVQKNKQFFYRIDFWNKEDATAPAQEVFILDTLDIDFAISSFEFQEIGFLKWNIPLE